MKKRLLDLYAASIDSGIKLYAKQYNELLAKAVTQCIKEKDDSLFRDIAIETEYETQYDSMLQIRKGFFNYNKEEQESLTYAM